MPPVTLSDPPKSSQDPPEATQDRPQSLPVLRFSDLRGTLSLDFCRLYRCCIDTVSIQHRYCIDTETEAQASFGVDPGSLRGGPGETLGGQRGVGGGHRRPIFFLYFRGFKIMKLCENLSLLLKWLEID